MKVTVEGEPKEIAELLTTIRHNEKINKSYSFGKVEIDNPEELAKVEHEIAVSLDISNLEELFKKYHAEKLFEENVDDEDDSVIDESH